MSTTTTTTTVSFCVSVVMEDVYCCRHWLMAECNEDCRLWCDRVNVVLHDLRAWHPYAVPAVRSTPKLAHAKQRF